jgi:hypothetical protein
MNAKSAHGNGQGLIAQRQPTPHQNGRSITAPHAMKMIFSAN